MRKSTNLILCMVLKFNLVHVTHTHTHRRKQVINSVFTGIRTIAADVFSLPGISSTITTLNLQGNLLTNLQPEVLRPLALPRGPVRESKRRTNIPSNQTPEYIGFDIEFQDPSQLHSTHACAHY
jgi:hypothetical protein